MREREREKERERDCGMEGAEGANKCKSFMGVRCVACRCMEEASCVCVCLCVYTHTHTLARVCRTHVCRLVWS